MQGEPIGRQREIEFSLVEAGHFIYREDPSFVLELIDDLVEAAGQ